MDNTKKIRRMAKLSMLCALSVILVYFVHFPLFPAVAFLEYDPADISVLIGTFAFGPWAGIALTLAVSLVQGLTVSAQSGWYGIIMHVISTGV
ncbi:MAG TPA: ECF transporter S component, partial [Ruminococcaceae bacterium]|nr:ECF transporter S component [Oscillospiraceae bacterium]